MATLPDTLENPPRSTGNPQQDIPLLVDWFFRACQVINQAVTYVGEQVEALGGTDDTLGSRLDGFVDGTVTVAETATGATVTLDTAQADTDYTIFIQAQSSSGAAAAGAFAIASKTYGTGGFSFTLVAAPGAGTSVTFDWRLIRNT